MSEYQNNTIDIAIRKEGEDKISDITKARRDLLEASLKLYRGLGGSQSQAVSLLGILYSGDKEPVADSIGDVMKALAIVSHNNDLDMMQAAYNLLDREREVVTSGD